MSIAAPPAPGGAAAFLFGRRTYKIFARSSGKIAEMRTQPIGIALNSKPKYVVSNTLTDPQWEGTTVLTNDIAAAVRSLFANNLIDELDLITYPIIIGQGTRLFPDTGPDIALDLLTSRTTPPRHNDPDLSPCWAAEVRKVTTQYNHHEKDQ